MALTKQVRPNSTDVTHGSHLLSDVLNGLPNTKYLNIEALRAVVPDAAGQTVEVLSAASGTYTEVHYGGGTFEAVAKTGTDDGGINIIPSTGTLMWRRIGYSVPELVFWGVKPDAEDNSAAITKAMMYLRSIKGTIIFPAWEVRSTQALPIWSECSIQGQGRAVSKFVKTTNNGYTVASGVSVDALMVCLPDNYDPAGGSMDSFCLRPNVRGISIERDAPTAANKSMYGIWGHKLAGGNFEDMLVLGANYGFYSTNVFLMKQSQVSYSGVVGSYAGVFIARLDTAGTSYLPAATTCNFTEVSCSGYNFGFYIANANSVVLTQCDCEHLARAVGESLCVAYKFINPMNSSMISCYTELVDGCMIQCSTSPSISIAHTLVVQSMNISSPNPGESFSQPTRLIQVDGGGSSLTVTFIGGDLRYAVAGSLNMLPPVASSANTKVILLGAVSNPWDTTSGGVVTTLA